MRYEQPEEQTARADRRPTCTIHSSEDPALAVADGPAVGPLPQDVPTPYPGGRVHSVLELRPLSHQNTLVVVTVDLEGGGHRYRAIKLD